MRTNNDGGGGEESCVLRRDAPSHGLRSRCVTTFSKHNNKLRRAANDSRRDKTKFDTRRSSNRRPPVSPRSARLADLSELMSPRVARRGYVRARQVTPELTRSHRATSPTGLFIRESNYASSSPGFIAWSSCPRLLRQRVSRVLTQSSALQPPPSPSSPFFFFSRVR